MFSLCNFVNVIDSRKTVQLNDIVANFYRHSTVCEGGGIRTLRSKALNVLREWKKRSVDGVANVLPDNHSPSDLGVTKHPDASFFPPKVFTYLA